MVAVRASHFLKHCRQALLTAFLVTLVAIAFSACDSGLAPLNEPSGFSGIIRYTNWPSPDSVRNIRLVAFEQLPSDSSGIITALLSGKAVIYPTLGQPNLPSFVDTTPYEFTTEGTTLQLKEYKYIAVAVQYGPNIFNDWMPAGVYPGSVRVLLHRISPGIDINVDFHNLPPKPWR